jgi:hypothetical protein
VFLYINYNNLNVNMEGTGFARAAAPWFFKDDDDVAGLQGFRQLDEVFHSMLVAASRDVPEGSDGLPMDDDVAAAAGGKAGDDEAAAADGGGDSLAKVSRTIHFEFDGKPFVAIARASHLVSAGDDAAFPESTRIRWEYVMSLPLLYEVALPPSLRRTAVLAPSMVLAVTNTTRLELERELPQLALWAGYFFLDGLPDDVEVKVGYGGTVAQIRFQSADSPVRLVVCFKPPCDSNGQES